MRCPGEAQASGASLLRTGLGTSDRGACWACLREVISAARPTCPASPAWCLEPSGDSQPEDPPTFSLRHLVDGFLKFQIMFHRPLKLLNCDPGLGKCSPLAFSSSPCPNNCDEVCFLCPRGSLEHPCQAVLCSLTLGLLALSLTR